MQAFAGGEIVGPHPQNQQIVGQIQRGEEGPEAIAQQPMHATAEKPREPGIADVERGKEHQPLVRGGIGAQRERRRGEPRKGDDVAQLDGEERRIAVRRAPVVALHGERRGGADHHDERREADGRGAERAVQVRPAAADEHHLRRQQHQPPQEYDTVDMDDEREWRLAFLFRRNRRPSSDIARPRCASAAPASGPQYAELPTDVAWTNK